MGGGGGGTRLQVGPSEMTWLLQALIVPIAANGHAMGTVGREWTGNLSLSGTFGKRMALNWLLRRPIFVRERGRRVLREGGGGVVSKGGSERGRKRGGRK